MAVRCYKSPPSSSVQPLIDALRRGFWPMEAPAYRIGVWPAVAWLLISLFSYGVARANVVVVSNRAGQTITLRIVSRRGTLESTLAPGDCAPFLTHGSATATYRPAASEIDSEQYTLQPNTAYFLRPAGEQVELHEIDMGGTRRTRADRQPLDVRVPVVIPVSLWVDDDQPFKEVYWKPRLIRRLEEASKITERYSGVQFQVQKTGEWDSDDNVTSFKGSLGEFINEVDPGGTLAIGFTSQYAVRQPRTKLGGTRFPLDNHILIREWRENIEVEHVEVLAHELGHYLGAMHSIEPDSVMRPLLADGLVRRKSFRIKFDPVNTLVMSMVGEEMRARPILELKELGPQTRARLEEIYTTIALISPEDPIPPKYIRMLY